VTASPPFLGFPDRLADGRVPRAVIFGAGQGATTRQHKESHQVMDVVEMYRPVTKWTAADGADVKRHHRAGRGDASS
jgi:hypothetical protein